MPKTKSKAGNTAKSTLKNYTEVDNILRAIAIIDSKKMKLESDMNDALIKIQQKYQPQMDKLNAEKLGYVRDIELFCKENKSEFESQRTKMLNYGEVGFRKGTGALKTLKGFTWEAVKSVIKSSKKLAENYLRVKEEVDKNKILTANLKPEELAKIGLCIHQEDNFIYEAYLKKPSEITAAPEN
jgi:phage host-nuclease inhibitor protein Gam